MTQDEIEQALKTVSSATPSQIAIMLGCNTKDLYDPLMRMVKAGSVRRRVEVIEGSNRKTWRYWHMLVSVTPPPYPNLKFSGEWQSDLFKLRDLNKR